ncbi:C_GCAxxG_C_C family probable redox protein [Natranaerovirga hydrolytica]|uniref:C_GCAxxG_C_C family probable redox protein n=1 Tax=Natranaerovirga hydrolytica TaxID=680378 RepID=A0A4R1MJW8_9FIRM|nr:C-GCAxxG-C-C family (seleno)protein [Natranaerovirga hydrolytica]TCK92755.1 C_GCAxxG_C_C family probable redox protein [Natranaerovirga hydrolytica]
MERVIEIFNEGYNCAETMIKVINEENNLDIPVSIGSPFGSGMGVGSVCGAITGALMALGAVKGRENPDVLNGSKKSTRDIMKAIQEKYGTYDCLTLKRNGVSCHEIIEETHRLLQKYT